MKKMSLPAHRHERFDLWFLLSAEQTAIANEIGRQRFELDMPERLNEPRLDRHQLGPRGELAAGCWLGVPIDLVLEQMRRPQRKGSPDIGKNLGVRTRSQWHYELNVMDRDPSAFKYLLVTEARFHGKTFHVMRGWLEGARCKQARVDDPKKKGVPGHFVPEEWLKDPIVLRETARRHYQRDEPVDVDELMRSIGRAAFGINYDERGHAL